MPISEEEKRWFIVGISLNKVLAPKLRTCVEKGFQSHYNNLDAKYHGLKTLTHATASSCPDLSKLKFGNINSNSLNHGNNKKNYSYAIKDHVDLAKLYLPDYLAMFNKFDDSLDVSAMLRLLGFSKPPIFPSTLPGSVQAAADHVKDNVRNKWGHCNLSEWTPAFYDDCFVSLENLVQSLDLTNVEAKELKDELKEWQLEGWAKCCMGNYDKELLAFIRQSEIINKEFPNSQNKMNEVMKRLKQVEGKQEELEKKVKGLTQTVEEFKLQATREGATNEQQAKEEFDLPKFRAQLSELYEATMSLVQRVPWDTDSTLHINDAYLPLSWCREDKQPSETLEEELDDYTDIFSGHKNCANPKRIVVEGQGGIGKSTFSQKLAVDWAGGEKEALKKFEILLIVKLRDVRGIRDFKDILVASGIVQSKNPAQVESLLQYIIENPDKVLIFLDGYDEYDKNLAQDATSDVRKIIAGSLFIGCNLVVTTRPQRKDEVKNMHSHCKIKGFTKDGIGKFASKYIKAEEEGKSFITYVSRRGLLDMAKIPLLLQFLCLLWNERKAEPLPTSKTALYQEVVQCILDHGHEKLSPGHLKSLDECSETLCKIGKLAFEALIQDSLVFEVSKLPDKVLDDGVCFGFFTTRVQCSDCSKKTTSFIHKSVQEFLAAWYIAKEVVPSTITEWLSFFDNSDRCFSSNFCDFFVYVCGLSTEGAVVVFQHLKSIGLKENLLPSGHDFCSLGSLSRVQLSFVQRCYELYSIADCKESTWQAFLECVNGVVIESSSQFVQIPVHPPLLRELLWYNGSFALYIEDYKQLEPVSSDLNQFDIEVISTFGVLHLTFSEFMRKCAASKAKHFWMMKKCSVFYIGFRYLYGDLPWLTELYQATASSEQGQSETEPDEQMENLVAHEQLHLTFHCLLPTRVVYSTPTVSTDIQILLHELKYASNLHFLNLTRLGVSPIMIDPLVRLVDKVSNLEVLNLSHNPLGPAGSILFCHLRSVPKLRELALEEANMTEREVVDLANTLEHVPLLELLDLSGNPIGQGAIALANNLHHVPDLKHLFLENTGMDAVCRAALKRAWANRSTEMHM